MGCNSRNKGPSKEVLIAMDTGVVCPCVASFWHKSSNLEPYSGLGCEMWLRHDLCGSVLESSPVPPHHPDYETNGLHLQPEFAYYVLTDVSPITNHDNP